MKTTRQKILTFITERRLASANEISAALKMSAANARHHLSVLTREGVLRVVRQQAPERGRPAQLFGLAQKSMQHNLDRLAAAVLGEWLAGLDQTERVTRLRLLAEKIVGRPQTLPANITQRLFRGLEVLNTLHYDARWEARADAPRVIFHHCPYRALVDQIPELCQMDTALLENQLGCRAILLARLETTPQGEQCTFKIQNNK